MSPSEVSQFIAAEIAGDYSRTNAHGVDLNTCLVTPEIRSYLDITNQTERIDLWLVLEEDPETKLGYKIVFDEFSKRCGLAMIDIDRRELLIGFYGTFLETLEAM